MAIELKKREGINLKKLNGEGLKSITLGLAWKSGRKLFTSTKSQGFFGKLLGKANDITETIDNRNIDLDSAIILYKGNTYVDTCFYGNKRIYLDNKKIIHHYGDDTTGRNKATKTDNEQIEVFLSDIDTNKVDTLYLIMNVFSHDVTLDQVRDAYTTVYDNEGAKIATYNLSDDYTNKNGVIVGKVIYDKSEGWKFIADGEGANISKINGFRI